MISEQAQEILDELYKVNPENLNEKARKLFDTVMEICDNRDLYKNRCDKAIEILKLCNSKCAKETINILQGNDNNE